MYYLFLNPAGQHEVATTRDFKIAIEKAKKKLSLEKQPHITISHEKRITVIPIASSRN